MRFQSVIFDMDGLLMDSERMGLRMMRRCAARQGYDVPVELIAQCIGITQQASSEKYHALYPQLDTERLFADFRESMHRSAAAGEIPAKRGARELLEYLKRSSIPAVVASSADPSTIAVYLKNAGLLDFFAALHSAKDMPSKPAPDVFLRAAEKLGVRPRECLVLEDSYSGVRAGRAAGMTVCMVPDVLPYCEELTPYVDYVVDDLEKVIGIMEQTMEEKADKEALG